MLIHRNIFDCKSIVIYAKSHFWEFDIIAIV